MSLSVSDNPLDFWEEQMIDKVFTNCDEDSSGKVSINKLINYLKQLTRNNSIDFTELDDLSSHFNAFADHNTLDIQSYRQAMTEWIGIMRQPSENYSDMLVQTENLCNQNNLLNDELDRLRNLLETAEDSFAASTRETVELREKIKKLQNVVDKKDALQRENEDLKSIVQYWMEKFEKERDSNENQQESILLENNKLKKNLEQNMTDYQNSLSKIQELKMQNSKLVKKKKIEIEKLSDNFEIEIIKLKTELNKAGENMTLLKKTNKELQTTNFDLVAQIIHLKENKSKFPEGVACPILPVVIEEDPDIHQQNNITDKAHTDVSFNQSNNTLSSELKGMVGESLPSPICEREHLSGSPDSNPQESRDSMLANLTNFKDILQSAVETVIEMKKQLVNFIDKMELKTNKDVNCVSCSEFRLSLMASLSQYKDWVELLVCKKATLNSWLSQMIKILTDSSLYSFEDPNDSKTNTPEHDVELATLKVIFKTIAMQLQKLSKPTVETDKDVEKKIWLLIMQHFLSKENYCEYLILWANLEVTEKYDRAELRNYNYHHRTSKALPEYSSGGKYGPSELEAYGTPLKLGRVLNVKEIWHLVQEEVEKKYLSDKKEYSNSADLWKDEIGKKFDGLQQKLYRKPTVFSALNSGRVAHSWQHDQRSCFFQVTPPCPTPLVDALTIERFDNGSSTQRNNKSEILRDFNIHECYNKDHAASCPTLDEQCNFVAGATQTDNLAYHLLYNHLNSSNSSSTSGVIDVDFSSSSSRSQDGQKKRKDFIRSSHKFESDSQTSQSMESNPENGTSLPRQRSPSFRAAIESRSNIHLLPLGDDSQINRKSSNYLTATQYQSNNHNEFIQCTRNRSLSFQAAIEDGQHSPIDTNDTDVISTSADITPDNPNLAEGFTPDMYGKIMLSTGRTDSRSVNFQLNTVATDFRTEPLTSGNISQSLKSDDLHSCHGSFLKSDEWKKTLRTGLNQEIEVSVTYASPSTSLDSSGSDVPKKSCIRDNSLSRNGSNAEGVQIINTSETSFKTSKTPEGELEMSPKKHIQSRNMRKLGVHSMEYSKETILQEENADSNSLKVANIKDTVICTQKQQEINSASKAAEETAVNIISGSENIDVTKNSKPDDISNHSLATSDNTSQLSKLRENNLARKREQMKHMKMPELTELAENASECNDASKANTFSLTNTFLQPPAPSDSMVLPSISDAFLVELGVFVDQYANFGSEDLTEQETENKFLSLSLAFKTDKQTLNQRLQIQKNSRDLAEDNVEKELKCLREASESLLQLSNDTQIRDAVKNIQHYIDVLEQAVARISGRAEVFGAVQQEERMSRAMEIMMSYVENLKRIREREHLELEEAKTLIDNKILNPEAGGDSSTLPRRATSLSSGPSKTTKRRASVAAVSKNPTPGGSVPGNSSMGIINKQEVYHRRSTLPAGKLLRRVNSFDKGHDLYEDSNDKEITHSDHSLEKTLEETKEEKEENDFQVGFRRGLAIKMDNMFEGLIQQQSNLVQHVQNMMVKSDLENASDVKLTLFAEVIREFQNDITSIWKGLNPFTQYTSIFIFAILTFVAIFLPMFRRLNIAVDEKYYDMPPF